MKMSKSATPVRMMEISAPISPTLPDSPSTSHNPYRDIGVGRPPRGRGKGPIGSPSTRLERDDHSSPTHDYLEQFHQTINPHHIPVSPSIHSMTSTPDFSSDKEPLGHSASQGFDNQYPSNRYLSSQHTSRTREKYVGPVLGTQRIQEQDKKRGCMPTDPKKRRWVFIGIPVALVVVAAVAVGVVVGVDQANKAKARSETGASGSGTTKGGGGGGASTDTGIPGQDDTASNPYLTAGTGQAGSTVTTDLGAEFVYSNDFGGSWAQNPEDPYSVSGRAQDYTPSLTEEWVWGKDNARGVNLGGWLVTEPFIVPALYERYQNTTPKAIDEYTLSQAIGSENLAEVMEEHYKTFITEQDFADIAAAGLNWVRIPIGYWAIETQEDEPFLRGVSWKYFTKSISWARKYGIRILLDYHALPGSQNGWNHSGKSGQINWMYGVMGIVNAQRHLETLRTLTQYISQPGIKEVVPMLSLVNEVQSEFTTIPAMQAFYYQAYEMIRGITGFGAGNGPMIAIHEGFVGIAEWDGFLSGADRLVLDQHPYLAFGTPNNNPWSQQASTACSWGGGTNDTQKSFGVTIGGEWSLAINNCGKWLNGVDSIPSYESTGQGSCTRFEEWFNWDQEMKDGLNSYCLSTMDALQNWFFWTWRIGNSTELGYAPSPFWHYQLGLKEGWIPKDPRVAGGYCGSVMKVGGNQFDGNFPASATGAVASPTIAAAQVAIHAVWPPASMGPSYTASQISLFPTLTQTGTPITLPTPSAKATGLGDGWFNKQDTVGAWTTVAGCTYLNEYSATAGPVPTAVCSGV